MTTITSAGDLVTQLAQLLAARAEVLVSGDVECQALRTAIRALTGEPQAAMGGPGPEARSPKPAPGLKTRPVPAPKAAVPARPVGRPKGSGSADSLEQRLLRALANGHRSARELQAETGSGIVSVRSALSDLQEAGQVHVQGRSRASRWHLGAAAPSAQPAKEAVRARRAG